MNDMKSRQAPRQVKTAKDALKNVLKAIFYRHECAKRNENVVRESKELLKLFPKTNKAQEKNSLFYIYGNPSVALTDWLIMETSGKPSSSLKSRKEKLVEYLQKWRVFPVPAPDKPFMPFPHEDSENLSKIYSITKPYLPAKYHLDCWGKIHKFEQHAIAELGLKVPIFSPFVTFPENPDLYPQFQANVQHQKNSPYRVVAIDLSQANEAIANYFSAWIGLQRVIVARRDKQKPAISAPKPTRKPDENLDQFLAALDYFRAHKKEGDQVINGKPKVINTKEMALGFYNQSCNEKKSYDNILFWFKNSKERAEHWSGHYHSLV